MTIYLKNKNSLIIDDFILRCSIGKNGLSKNKFEELINDGFTDDDKKEHKTDIRIDKIFTKKSQTTDLNSHMAELLLEKSQKNSKVET